MTHQRDLALAARSFLRQQTGRLLKPNQDLGYWGGVSWLFNGTIVNAAGASGTHTYRFNPGEDNEFEILYGTLRNGDTSSRSSFNSIQSLLPVNRIVADLTPRSFAVAAAGFMPIMANDEVANNGGHRMQRPIVSGSNMVLDIALASVAANQDTAVTVMLRVRGDAPTVTMTGGADAATDIEIAEFV